jgi:hypothetical protein
MHIALDCLAVVFLPSLVPGSQVGQNGTEEQGLATLALRQNWGRIFLLAFARGTVGAITLCDLWWVCRPSSQWRARSGSWGTLGVVELEPEQGPGTGQRSGFAGQEWFLCLSQWQCTFLLLPWCLVLPPQETLPGEVGEGSNCLSQTGAPWNLYQTGALHCLSALSTLSSVTPLLK